MIISLRTLTYDELKKALTPEDKIVLWSCDTCIRFSGLGGIHKLQILEDMLAADGYQIAKKELLGVSCVDRVVEDRKYDDTKKEIFDAATAIIVLGCEEAWERVHIAFPDKKVIQVTRSFGFGNVSEERGVFLTSPFEDTEFEVVPGGIPVAEVAARSNTYHTFFDSDLKEPVKPKLVEITVDGQKVLVREGANLLDECEENGFPIPHLCHMKGLSPTGACRMCLVRIEGSRGLVASCCTVVTKGMKVTTENDEIKEDRRITLELLLSAQGHDCLTCVKDDTCELRKLIREYNVEAPRFGRGLFESLPLDESSDAIVLDPNRCILCGRCVRACDEVAGVHNLSFAHRGSRTVVVPGMNKSWAASDCITCMACVYACPTGALYEKMLYFDGQDWKPRKLYGRYYQDLSHLINTSD